MLLIRTSHELEKLRVINAPKASRKILFEHEPLSPSLYSRVKNARVTGAWDTRQLSRPFTLFFTPVSLVLWPCLSRPARTNAYVDTRSKCATRMAFVSALGALLLLLLTLHRSLPAFASAVHAAPHESAHSRPAGASSAVTQVHLAYGGVLWLFCIVSPRTRTRTAFVQRMSTVTSSILYRIL